MFFLSFFGGALTSGSDGCDALFCFLFLPLSHALSLHPVLLLCCCCCLFFLFLLFPFFSLLDFNNWIQIKLNSFEFLLLLFIFPINSIICVLNNILVFIYMDYLKIWMWKNNWKKPFAVVVCENNFMCVFFHLILKL